MKRKLVIGIIILQAALFGQRSNSNNFSVSGVFQETILSDRAQLSVRITADGSTLVDATKRVNEKANDIAETLIDGGLSKENVYSSKFRSSSKQIERFVFTDSRVFKVQVSLHITIDDLETLEPTILKLSELEVDEIYNIKYSIKDMDSIKEKASIAAIMNAKENAKKYSEILGVEIGPLVRFEQPSIQINPIDRVSRNQVTVTAERPMPNKKGYLAYLPKPMKVNASVRLTYSLPDE